MFVEPGSVSNLSGRLAVQSLKATFTRGQQGLPADLHLQGQITKGEIALVSKSYNDILRNVQLDFSGDAGQVQAKGAWASEQLGPVQASGQYDLAKHAGQGVIDADISGLKLPMESDSAGERVTRALLKTYGRSSMNIAVQGAKSQDWAIELSRKTEPALSGRLHFAQGPAGMRLAALHAEGTVPVAILASVSPDAARFDGGAPVAVDMDAGASHFSAQADLSPCMLALGKTLEKAPGAPLQIAIEGDAPGVPWKPATLAVSLSGQTVQGRFEQGRLIAD